MAKKTSRASGRKNQEWLRECARLESVRRAVRRAIVDMERAVSISVSLNSVLSDRNAGVIASGGALRNASRELMSIVINARAGLLSPEVAGEAFVAKQKAVDLAEAREGSAGLSLSVARMERQDAIDTQAIGLL